MAYLWLQPLYPQLGHTGYSNLLVHYFCCNPFVSTNSLSSPFSRPSVLIILSSEWDEFLVCRSDHQLSLLLSSLSHSLANMVGRPSRLSPRGILVNGASYDKNTGDDSIILTTTARKQNGSSATKTSSKKRQKVAFEEQMTVRLCKQIPKTYAKDLWYAPSDVFEFRNDIVKIKELALKAKLKSVRSRNHTRRVLLQYRTDKANVQMSTSRTMRNRSENNLKNVSKISSQKATELAIKTAELLEIEVVEDRRSYYPELASACFGASRQWAFDYYLGDMIDSICFMSSE